MVLKRLQKDNDGNIESTWILTPEQYYTFINYAVNDLLAKGAIEALDIDEEEAAKIMQEYENKSLLESANIEDLPQA